MTGICGHLPGATCSNCAPQWASIAPWPSLPPDALGRIADALEKLVDAYAQAQRRDHYALSDRYAANEARQREEAEPDPLDEDDHRDRVDVNGNLRYRNPGGCWHLGCYGCHGCRWTLGHLNRLLGPLTFAPEASPAPQDAAQGAAEGEADAMEGGGVAGPPEALLCHECAHDIDEHRGLGCPWCICDLAPSDIARHLIAQATS